MHSLGRTLRLREALPLLVLAALVAGVLRLAGSARLEPADVSFNNGAEIQTLDPATVTGVPEGRILRAIFEGLCMKDPRTLEPLPGAAESWEISADGLLYTFRIRAGARWTNGDPVTAHDFAFSWERMLHPRTAAEYAYQLWYVQGARQYSLLVDDLLYRASFEQGTWVERIERGARLRIGLSGYLLEDLDAADRPRLLVRPGDELAAGAPFLATAKGPVETPVAGRVRAVNGELAESFGALRADPYGASWMIELEPAPGALERELDAGRLVPGEDFRREWVVPRRLGIRARDERTLEVRLEAPTPYFLDLVAFYPLYPVNRRNLEEAKARFPGRWELEWMRPEHIVTNGPFRVAFRRVNDRIRMVKNHDYWDADNVALESIDALAVDRLGTSLNLYLTGEVDWIDRPITNVVPRLMPREDFEPTPYLGSYYYRVNVTKPPFDDPRVRRALSLTIDRKAIVEKITKAGEVPAWSYVPPVLKGYPTVETECESAAGWREGRYAEAFQRDVERARTLMAEAGFGPGGRAFPTFEIHYNTDETHKDVAEVLADGWKRHFGMNVKLLNQEWKVYLDTQKTIGYDVSRSAWIGDYPDPNTFLDMFVTGGENNRTGWGDPRYDERIRRAALEADLGRRAELLAEAEAILMDELPILPIYYYVTRNLVNPRLGGLHQNFLDEHFPKHFYWMDDEELAEKRAALPPGKVEVPARGPSEGLYSPAARRARGGA